MDDETPAPPLPCADHALLDAARAWGREAAEDLWSLFRPERAAVLRAAWDGRGDGEPLDRLRRGHDAQVRPDLARVHASWWVRALKDEPRSVRSAVAASLPEGTLESLGDELRLTTLDLVPGRTPNPLALSVARALWRERLVGDLPERDDDPPVIAALTRFDSPVTTRLIRTTGLAKWSLTEDPTVPIDPADRPQSEHLRGALSPSDPRLTELSARDVAVLRSSGPKAVARLGLTTLARLLQTADQYRVRWALQHLPYAAAKSIRALSGPPGRRSPTTARLETRVLRAAWVLLVGEGRISEPWRWGDGT